jgi:hypothetical protein
MISSDTLIRDLSMRFDSKSYLFGYGLFAPVL